MQPVSMQECPRCGAPLPHSETETPRICTYCGTVVTRPPASLEPPAPPRAPLRTAKPLVLLASLSSVLVLGAAAAISQLAQRSPASPLQVQAQPPETRESEREIEQPSALPRAYVGEGLLLLNAGNDPVEDLLVVASRAAGAAEQRWWLAVDGATGRELWRYALPGRQKQPPLAGLSEGVLMLTSDTQLTALDPSTARVLWRQPLTRPVESLCTTEDYVGVRYSTTAAPNKAPALDAFVNTRGTVVAHAVLARSARNCTPAYTTRSAGPNFSYVEGPALHAWLPKTHNFRVQRGLLPNQGAARVALGTGPLRAVPSPTGPAALGVIAGRNWLWQGLVASDQAGLPRLLDPPLAAVRRERIVVPHLLTGDPTLRVASFELTKGRWQWERGLERLPNALAGQASGTALAISRTGPVFVRTPTGRLFALDLDTGAVRWQLEP